MSTHVNDIKAFNQKFGLLAFDTPGHLTQRKLVERIECMQEELDEFIHACGLLTGSLNGLQVNDTQGSLADQADALVDLVYFAIGTAVMMGLPWQQLWDDVHRANMGKVPGATKREGHRRDLMKPPGWQGPVGETILRLDGYEPLDYLSMGESDDSVYIIDEAKCRDDAA